MRASHLASIWIVLVITARASLAGAQDAAEPPPDAEIAAEPTPLDEEAPADSAAADDAPSGDEPPEVEVAPEPLAPVEVAPVEASEAAPEQASRETSGDEREGRGEDQEEEGDDADELTFGARVGGDYRHRFVMMSDIPLEPLPRTDPAQTGELGQNYWGEQWLRLRGELALRPILRLVGELDLLWGVAYGDLAIGTAPAQWARDEYGYPGLRLRQLYLEWLTPIGLIRAGQMTFSWGLGMVANSGGDPPVFGDARFGDLVRRLLFATKPAGRDSPFTLAVAGDWVAWDQTADFERRGDLAFQGVVAAYYEEEGDRVGGYVAYRHQTNPLDDTLEVFVADLVAQLHFAEPSGGRILTALELAYIRGTTTYTRTIDFPTQDVEQLMLVARLGRKERHVDVILEGGYASGDSNPEDGIQRRATIDPDHRVGLLLFPEVLAAQTARSAFLAGSPELFGRPARGVELLPTNGGVAGAYYFFPHVLWRPLEWLEARFAAVLAWASTDVVDPFAQRARSRSANYRGGDPARRDLGLELDAALLLHGPIADRVILSGGLEGGVLFPGRAFDDAMGNPMGTIGLLRARLGLSY